MSKSNLVIGGFILFSIFLTILVYWKIATKPQPTFEQIPTPTPTVGLANPASVNCEKVGGKTQIMNGPNGQYGLCLFEDDYACEEWALYRNECPVGGVRTTGFDNIEQKYCAWVGGQTLAVPDAQCTLPSGTVCTDKAVYNGECEQTN